MVGEWKWYWENGNLMQIGTFTNEKKNGIWTRFKEDGSLLDETKFMDGKKVKQK
jgi:antitoxin component YwqK of YwqJK toxin-antitoxin module